jgi:NADPH2:quinone reductase
MACSTRKALFSTISMPFRGISVTEFGVPTVLTVNNSIPALVPGAKQVVVKMRAAGVNPVDTYIRAGTYAKLPTLPYTPGNDGAGFVEAIGEEVSNVKVGDRVYITRSVSGTYAEKSLCDSSQV